MKRICLYLLLLFSAPLFGQVNLVQNGDFEQYDTCVTTVGQLYNCTGWHIYRASPDYFNTCADSASLVSIPYNGLGYQWPISGNGYCGFFAYGNTAGLQTNYREVLGSQLSSTLIIGTKYYVTFYVNNSYGSYASTRTSCNKIGVLFSTASFDSVNAPAPINNFAHVYTDSIINDTSTWFKIKGSFVADSAYSFISIGNFFDAAHTDTVMFAPSSLGAYYYVDNVCVSTDSLLCTGVSNSIRETEKEIDITISPNPTSHYFTVKVQQNLVLEMVSVYSLVGEMVMEQNASGNASELTVNLTNLPKGIYLVKIKTNKGMGYKKFVKE